SRAIQLRRKGVRFDIPDEAIQRVGFVPSPKPSRTLPYGHVRLALWCDPGAVVGMPDELAEVATVDDSTAWLLLDGIEAISTAQLVGLRLMYADRWTVADARGVPRDADEPELAALFDAAPRLGFDRARATYTLDGRDIANAVERGGSLRGRVSKNPKALPYTFEVRDALLQTRWVINKPDAAWKTAFYVTDRAGQRVGTLRAITEGSDNFDLCGTDNLVLATLRTGDEQSTIVDTSGVTLATWDKPSGEFAVDAPAGTTVRVLCLLAPVVATFTRATA
ncbi:MAG TPA: hypothetical protein VE172_08805, partial [Stackebrandtia sp.]|uniref:hypothetical protein n=1 Tax=Stackebrandtia sp. TaxID=2023065 RepID=UPI002D48A58B